MTAFTMERLPILTFPNVPPESLMPRLTCCYATIAVLLAPFPVGAEDWPQWRGPNRDGRSTETGLLAEWPDGGPAVVWHVESAGVGYSSLAIRDGRVITQGDLNGVEHIICVSEEDGSLLWAVQPAPVAAALQERVDREFARYDRNEDGTIDPVESLELGSNLELESETAGDPDTIAASRAAALFEALDENQDGRLSFDEFPGSARDIFSQSDRTDPDADVEALAAARTAVALERDTDNDHQISRQEARGTSLDGAFNQIDEKLPGERRGDGELTASELSSYFSTRERGRDGELTPEELAAYFRRSLTNRDGVVTRDDVMSIFGGYRNNRGDGPRGTPTIDGEFVYVEGGNGDVTCLRADSGETVWHVSLTGDLGGGRPGWGYSESPLVVDDLVVVTPGGRDGTLAALDKRTGEVKWRSGDVTQGAHYASAMSAYVAGTRQIVQFARESVFGVNLEDGSFLWSYSGAANGTANCSTPVIDGDYVLSASAYGTGAGLVKVSGSAVEQAADEIYFEESLQNHHGGIVKVGDYVYGTGGNTLICMNFMTGEIAWEARAAGKGSLLNADGHLYCLGERNSVVLCEANPEEYVETGRFEIPETGLPSWAHPAIANGRLYIRDQHRLTAYDISAD